MAFQGFCTGIWQKFADFELAVVGGAVPTDLFSALVFAFNGSWSMPAILRLVIRMRRVARVPMEPLHMHFREQQGDDQ